MYKVSSSVAWSYESSGGSIKSDGDLVMDTDIMCRNENPNKPCNCDTATMKSFDYGRIVNNEKLPIMTVNYSQPSVADDVQIKVGPLICIPPTYFQNISNPCADKPCGDNGHCYLTSQTTYACHCKPGYPSELDKNCQICMCSVKTI